MSGLAQTQAALSAAILAPSSECIDARRFTPRGLEIYHQAYRLRLIEVLYNDFPVLAQAIGDRAFGALARGYVEHHRSTHFSVRWFGRNFPAFVLRNADTDLRRDWAELVRLEWLLGEAFDARDDLVIGPAALAAIPGQNWPTISLSFHPSVRTLRVQASTLRWWSSMRSEAGCAATPLESVGSGDGRSTVVIWRVDTQVRYRPLDTAPAAALMAALAGASMSSMCEALSRYHVPDEVPARVAGLLAEWLGAGLVTAVLGGD